MAATTGTQRVTFIILRFMRKPIFVLIGVYAVSMLGWVLIPGPEGSESSYSFFHAFYFLAYTATTTGFGELPYAFSDAQRAWAIVSLYSGVIAWLYAIGAIIQLIQNPHFQLALAERSFAKTVARLTEPFVLVCGFGNRGSLLTRGLSDAGIAAVIVDEDQDRINAVHLRDYRVPTPAMCADVRVPERLIEAGVTRPNCNAVVALTGDEEVNAKVAVTARLLNPHARVVTQLTRDVHEETLSALGADIHIVDPFQTFARYLGATIHNPAVHMLNEWLIGAPNANLAMYADVPRGTWILCGFGRMGRAIHEALQALAVPAVVIDPEAKGGDEANCIVGRANQRTLRKAGIEQAAGIVAGTNNDADNLSIALHARALNPDIFVIVRQNRHHNHMLFAAADADLIMQPTLVSARRVLFLLIAPLLKTFFEHIRACQVQARDDFLIDVISQLQSAIGSTTHPRLWTVRIDDASAAAAVGIIRQGRRVTLNDILRDPGDRAAQLQTVPMVIRSDAHAKVMPQLSHPVNEGDEILFCGRNRAYRLLDATLNNEYTLRYLMTGIDEPHSPAMRWLTRKREARAAVTAGPSPPN